MSTISEFMAGHHRQCDELFAEVENLVSAKKWQEVESVYSRFLDALDLHLRAEEEILFEALSEEGGPQGPIQMMKYEHSQMRLLIDDMNEASSGRDGQKFLGNSETFMMLIQQHNMKEEQILYPMADDFLSGRSEELIQQVERLLRSHG